jgi:hypothetical protein
VGELQKTLAGFQGTPNMPSKAVAPLEGAIVKLQAAVDALKKQGGRRKTRRSKGTRGTRRR